SPVSDTTSPRARHYGFTTTAFDFPSDTSEDGTYDPAGDTSASATPTTPEIGRVWAEETTAVEGTTFRNEDEILERYDAEVAAEANELRAGSVEMYTVVTSLSAYITVPAFQEYLADFVVRDFTRLSTYTSLCVNHLLLHVCAGEHDVRLPNDDAIPLVVRRTNLLERIFHMRTKPGDAETLYHRILCAFEEPRGQLNAPDDIRPILSASVNSIRAALGYEQVLPKGYTNPTIFLATQMSTNFETSIVGNLYGRLRSYFKMDLVRLPAFMLRKTGGLPPNITVDLLEADDVWNNGVGEGVQVEEVGDAAVADFLDGQVDEEDLEVAAQEEDVLAAPVVADVNAAGDEDGGGDDGGADEGPAQVNNPYGVGVNRLVNLLTNIFYFGNVDLIRLIATGHPRTVRQVLRRIIERSENRLFTPTRQMVDAAQGLTRNVMAHFDLKSHWMDK
ncbi:hypothetical protein HDV05_000734, partial [Chytridiales sp. JEL 0842]